MLINVGDIVYLTSRAQASDGPIHYKVLKVSDGYVTKVASVKNPDWSQDCNIAFSGFTLVEQLTPKELVCRKIQQMEHRFKNRYAF